LLEPGDVVPAWKCWSPILLRPEGLYGTRPAAGGSKAAKLKAIREGLCSGKRVWLATDCDREGQLIGQEILEHYEYRGQIMEAQGIGTPATRAEIIGGLKKEGFLIAQGKNIVPTETGLSLFGLLKQADPALVGAIDAVCDVAQRIIGKLNEGGAG
jgi:DNA topoisomerase IA